MGFSDWVCGEKWFWILCLVWDFLSRLWRAKCAGVREVRCGVWIRCGMVLDFGLVWGFCRLFVAREARREVCDSGFVLENGPQPWPWPLIMC